MFYSSKRQQYAARLGNLAMGYEEIVKANGHIKCFQDHQLILQQRHTRIDGVPTAQQNFPSRKQRRIAKEKRRPRWPGKPRRHNEALQRTIQVHNM